MEIRSVSEVTTVYGTEVQQPAKTDSLYVFRKESIKISLPSKLVMFLEPFLSSVCGGSVLRAFFQSYFALGPPPLL